MSNQQYSSSSSSNGQQNSINVEANVSNGGQASQQPFPGEKQFIDAIEKANKDLKISNTSLKFSIHEGTKQILVKIVDNETKETVKEIPPEKILDMVAAMLERTGLFVDKKI